jgi:hypothetical protein
MNAINAFLRQHFCVMAAFALVWNVCIFGYMSWRRAKQGRKFPPLSQVRVLFREQFASGYSHKSWITRFGGASNCLTITVTEDELWIGTFFPFSILLNTYDLEHRIHYSQIVLVEQQKQRITIDFKVDDSEVRRLTLVSRKADELRSVLTMHAGGGSNRIAV